MEDLLLLSRLDARHLQLNFSPVDLEVLLEEITWQTGKLAGSEGPHIELGPAGGIAWGDAVRLRQVMLILLDNAMRYTPTSGSIRLEAFQQAKFCEIHVLDSGHGIAAEHLPHLFERFYQAPYSGDETRRGNGLGLSIAKDLVEAQKGTIKLHSQIGKGTRAVIRLQVAKFK